MAAPRREVQVAGRGYSQPRAGLADSEAALQRGGVLHASGKFSLFSLLALELIQRHMRGRVECEARGGAWSAEVARWL